MYFSLCRDVSGFHLFFTLEAGELQLNYCRFVNDTTLKR